MPENRPAPDAPDRAVDAIIDRLLEKLASPQNTEALNKARAEFRRRVPLHLRSYAAAALILEAAEQGGQHTRSGRRGEDSRRGRDEGRTGRQEGRSRGNSGTQDGRHEQKAERPAGQEGPGSQRSEEPRPRYQGEGTTVFFGMGKRQRLYPRILLRILTEEGGLSLEEIGDIRSFDNYSFADITPDKAEAIIEKLNGVEFRGRGIPVNKARKRGEELPEQDTADDAAQTAAPSETGPDAVSEDNSCETGTDDRDSEVSDSASGDGTKDSSQS